MSTTPAQFASDIERLRATFATGVTRSKAWRVARLRDLARFCDNEKAALVTALSADLGRSSAEAAMEVASAVRECNEARRAVGGWMVPEQVSTNGMVAPAHTEVTLIVAPFNYPLALIVHPLVGAIAGGNCAVMKPSEISSHTEQAIAALLPRYLPRDAFAVATGGIAASTALLALKWDMIFFTGSPRVGQIVARAAAEQLTPVVLELGGKAPAVVTKSCASVDEAARRIAFGKWVNCGQTCMAPDYVIVHESLHAELVKALQKYLKVFYGAEPAKSPDYARVVSPVHVDRLEKMLGQSRATLLTAGGALRSKIDARYLAPTIADNCALDDVLLREEIFGPVLPIVTFRDEADAVAKVLAIDKSPLALYVFTGSNAALAERLLKAVPSGDSIVNDVFMHCASGTTPFGGKGHSGYGAYRGKHSFESFTYKRGVLFRHGIFDIASLLPDGAGNVKYPPNTALRKVLLPMTVQYLPMLPRLFTLKNGLWLAAAVCMARKDSREVVVAKVLAGIRAAVEA